MAWSGTSPVQQKFKPVSQRKHVCWATSNMAKGGLVQQPHNIAMTGKTGMLGVKGYVQTMSEEHEK